MQNCDKGTVILKDFEVFACHGVNPQEKVTPQRFIFTAKVYCDFSMAAENDDIDKTVSYSAIKKYIKSFCEQNCFNLIETLASRTAEGILSEFSLAESVKLTVKKPDAPMSGTFAYAAVEVERAWHTVYLALGSSEGDRHSFLDFAIDQLRVNPQIKQVRESTRLDNAPYGGVAKQAFVNSVVECRTMLSAKRLLAFIHDIEQRGGRVRKERWGDRTLDIDIIFYDDLICGESELVLPHIDMQNRLFVLEPLMELCPDKVHPLFGKRVRELYYALAIKEK